MLLVTGVKFESKVPRSNFNITLIYNYMIQVRIAAIDTFYNFGRDTEGLYSCVGGVEQGKVWLQRKSVRKGG